MKRAIRSAGWLGAMMLSAGTALADAMPSGPAAAPASAPINWSGFYFGVSAGQAFGHRNVDRFPDFGTVTRSDLNDAGAYGGHIGIQHQWGAFVAGIEVSGIWSDFHGEAGCPNPAFLCVHRSKNLADVRGRLGFAFDHFHLYGTAGWGWTDDQWHAQDVATGTLFEVASKANLDGAVYGAGLEIMPMPRVVLGVEYLHYDMGQSYNRVTTTVGGTPVERLRVDTGDFDVFRARLSILFGRDRETAMPLK